MGDHLLHNEVVMVCPPVKGGGVRGGQMANAARGAGPGNGSHYSDLWRGGELEMMCQAMRKLRNR